MRCFPTTWSFLLYGRASGPSGRFHGAPVRAIRGGLEGKPKWKYTISCSLSGDGAIEAMIFAISFALGMRIWRMRGLGPFEALASWAHEVGRARGYKLGCIVSTVKEKKILAQTRDKKETRLTGSDSSDEQLA